jgi:hypothetical protein
MEPFIIPMPSWLAKPKCEADPYLRIAFATGFQDYNLEAFTGAGQIPVVVETVASAKDVQQAVKVALSQRVNRIDLAGLSAAIPFFTAHVGMKTVELLHQDIAIKRVELAMPLRVQRYVPHLHTIARSPPVAVNKSAGDMLIGVIDSGCPFAHQAFRLGADDTRVLGVWDQDARPDFVTGGPPAGFSYGRYVPRSVLKGFMDASKDRDGVIRESLCYEAANHSLMRSTRSHGAHTLGLAGGDIAYKALGHNAQTDVGKFKLTDRAARSDLVFVQLPRDSLQAPTRGSQAMHLLNGLKFIMESAGPKVKDIYTVIDYGSYLGPHDGTSLFERAVDSLVKQLKNQTPKLRKNLHVIFPTGNGRNEKFHAGTAIDSGVSSSLDLWLPPNNEVATFAELWLRKNTQWDHLKLHTPDGVSMLQSAKVMEETSCLGSRRSPVAAIDVSQSSDGQICVLTRIAPTRTDSVNQEAAQDGRWLFELKATSTDTAHFYVARGGKNFSAVRRTFQPRWKVRANVTVLNPVWIDTHHTTIGAGCGNRTLMLGSFNSWNRKPTKYSGRGPRRGGLNGTIGPNYLVVGEEAQTLRGIRGIGNRSGSTFRMVGTSTAPPQAVRKLSKVKKAPVNSSAKVSAPDDPIDNLGEILL